MSVACVGSVSNDSSSGEGRWPVRALPATPNRSWRGAATVPRERRCRRPTPRPPSPASGSHPGFSGLPRCPSEPFHWKSFPFLTIPPSFIKHQGAASSQGGPHSWGTAKILLLQPARMFHLRDPPPPGVTPLGRGGGWVPKAPGPQDGHLQRRFGLVGGPEPTPAVGCLP